MILTFDYTIEYFNDYKTPESASSLLTVGMEYLDDGMIAPGTYIVECLSPVFAWLYNES